jgi:hypothetical protein
LSFAAEIFLLNTRKVKAKDWEIEPSLTASQPQLRMPYKLFLRAYAQLILTLGMPANLTLDVVH